MIIKCKVCGINLTAELKPLGNTNFLREEDATDFVPSGYYYICEDDYFIDQNKGIAINTNDKLNLRNHTDTSRLNGCCGLDGCDGLNQVCKNGHEVATERSDCWTAHSVIFDSNLVELKGN